MKTTIETSDPPLSQARKLGEREGVGLRAQVELGLHRVVTATRSNAPLRLRRASFKGNGLQAGLRDAGWEALREPAYQNRSG